MVGVRIEVLLMRHGAAEDWAEGGDARRELTARGRTTAVRVGTMLRAARWCPTVAIASPFVRAQQTSNGVLEASGARLSVGLEPRLVPSGSVAGVVASLFDAAADEPDARVLAVGHNPCISLVLSSLFGDGGGIRFAISTGDLVRMVLERREPGGVSPVMLAFVPAAILDALAG